MTKPHQQYEFGTFDERLAHISALLDIDPFPFVLDKPNEPKLCDDALAWIKQNGIDMDWLFCGSPSGALKQYSEQRKRDTTHFELLGKMEPKIQTALYIALNAVLTLDLPIKDAMATLEEAVAVHRQA